MANYGCGFVRVFEPAASSHSGKGNTATSALKDTAEEIGIQASSTPSGSSDWMEPSLHICNSRMVRPYVPNRVYEAFHLMQTEPAIKVLYHSMPKFQLQFKPGNVVKLIYVSPFISIENGCFIVI